MDETAAALVQFLANNTGGRSGLRWHSFRDTWTTTVNGAEIQLRAGDGGRFSPTWELRIHAPGQRGSRPITSDSRDGSQINTAMLNLLATLQAA